METLKNAIDQAVLRQAASMGALSADTHAADLRQVIRSREWAIKSDIANTTNPEDGKPLFSNDVRRDAEFIRRAADDLQLRDYNAQLAAFEYDAAQCKIDAQYHADLIRIGCAYAEAQKAGAL